MLSWRHSGFSIFVGDPIPPEKKQNLERLARYLKRLHVAESRIVYDEEHARVIVSSGKAPAPSGRQGAAACSAGGSQRGQLELAGAHEEDLRG